MPRDLLSLLISVISLLSQDERDLLFYKCVPTDQLFNVGEHFKNSRWVQHAIDTDVDLEYIDSPEKREAENFHSINVLLGT